MTGTALFVNGAVAQNAGLAAADTRRADTGRNGSVGMGTAQSRKRYNCRGDPGAKMQSFDL
jgi:hypothetical protein